MSLDQFLGVASYYLAGASILFILFNAYRFVTGRTYFFQDDEYMYLYGIFCSIPCVNIIVVCIVLFLGSCALLFWGCCVLRKRAIQKRLDAMSVVLALAMTTMLAGCGNSESKRIEAMTKLNDACNNANGTLTITLNMGGFFGDTASVSCSSNCRKDILK